MVALRGLDLFCCAGGAGVGYARAGFVMTGIDTTFQKRYPFQFIQADALDYLEKHGHEYDFIHASPPCQPFSKISKVAGVENDYPDLIEPVRKLLQATDKPYVIENVPGSPLKDALMLCGTMFGLNVIRHRLFETSFHIPHFGHPHCNHVKRVVKHGRKPDREKHYAAVTGHMSDVEFCRKSMGIDWMIADELKEAIPPAYTEYIGRFVMEYITGAKQTAQADYVSKH